MLRVKRAVVGVVAATALVGGLVGAGTAGASTPSGATKSVQAADSSVRALNATKPGAKCKAKQKGKARKTKYGKLKCTKTGKKYVWKKVTAPAPPSPATTPTTPAPTTPPPAPVVVAQTITFTQPADWEVDAGPVALSATATSGLTVTFASTTTSVCTVSGASVTLVSTGTCTINANQVGNSTFTAAPQVSRSFLVNFAVSAAGRYEIGSVALRDLWVDPVAGNDSNSGDTRAAALRTVDQAWRRIPPELALTEGVRVQLAAGTYDSANLPNYWESRWGTADAPIVLNAADGAHTARFTGDMNVFGTRYLYVIGVDIITSGDAFHCEQCQYVLLRNMELSGGARVARETVKVNQSDHIYIEDSDIHGAEDNNIDFVAVQYGHVLGNKIHDAGDWCAYAKGGSAYLTVAENEIYDCGTGGFTAGQGTGFEFMSTPWLHYEAYDIRVFNNLVHDTEGAGLGVNGGYNILMAYNTMYRVGSRAHALEFVFGARGCDGELAACNQRRDAGGWGSSQSDSGTGWVPNKHVYVYNNVLYNPSGFRSLYSQFAIYGPRTVPSGNTLTGAQRDDDDLRIAGNVIWNGPSTLDLGVGGSEGCGSFNPTCNETQLLADNAINTVQPQLDSSLRPTPGGNIATRSGVAIPSFTWTDAPAVPAVPMRSGFGSNSVPLTITGSARTAWGHPGAY